MHFLADARSRLGADVPKSVGMAEADGFPNRYQNELMNPQGAIKNRLAITPAVLGAWPTGTRLSSFYRFFLLFLASLALTVQAGPQATPVALHGAIGVGTRGASVEFKDIIVTDTNGMVLYRSDFANQGTNGWRFHNGAWSLRDGVLRQTATADCHAIIGDTNWANYTLTLRIRKVWGDKGFCILFNCLNDEDRTSFQLGPGKNAWIIQYVNGTDSILGSDVPLDLAFNTWYDIRVVVDAAGMACYVNNRLVESVAWSRGKFISKSLVAGSRPDQEAPHGAMGVGCWNTAVEYKDIVVTSHNVVLYRSDFARDGTNGWHDFGGTWNVRDGAYQQTDVAPACRTILGQTNWADYTITLRARKLRGDEGFLVLFNWLDDKNWCWLNIGQWQEYACIEQSINGNCTGLGTKIPISVEPEVWYDIRVVLTGPRIDCYLNGRPLVSITTSNGYACSETPHLPAMGGAIQSVAQVMELSGASASKGMPVHAEGVVIDVDPVKGGVLFKDATGAIPVPVDLARNPVPPGARVVLNGRTSAELIRYPDHPSGSHLLTSFEAPVNVGDLYLARVRGYLYPPHTGDYSFWIASDNGSELWLSSDANPDHVFKIASSGYDAGAYVAFHGWDQTTNQHSAKIHLEAGHGYYVEALHYQQIGEDFLSVAWDGPGFSRTVIDGTFLSPPEAADAPDQNQRGSILREFWLSYPFGSDADAISWLKSVAVPEERSVTAMLKNPPTHYGRPLITEASLTPLENTSAPSVKPIRVGQSWSGEEDYQWVEVEGLVSLVAEADDFHTVLELTDQGRQMTARLANPEHRRLNGLVNARVRLRGFCASALAANGERVASVLSVPNLREISLRPPADEDWDRLPLLPMPDLDASHTTARVGQRVRIAGQYKEGTPGQFLILRAPVSRFSACVSTNGSDWSQVGDPVEIPISQRVDSGIATYGTGSTNQCLADYDHVSAWLFPGSEEEIGRPPVPGSSRGNAEHLVTSATGFIGGRAGTDRLQKDAFHFLYRPLDGDGEIVAHVASVMASSTDGIDGGAGLMMRESLQPNAKMFYLVVSTISGVDLRVRRGTGNPVESFPHGAVAPYWLKITKQSVPPLKVDCAQLPELAPQQRIEVMGRLEYTHGGWCLREAFCRIPPAEWAGTGAPGQPGNTTVQQIRQLGVDELKLGRPATIHGVITANADDIFVQDDTGGIRIPSTAAQRFAGCEAGQRVTVMGHYAPGPFSPILQPGHEEDSVVLLGRGQMPQPLTCTWNELTQGRQDAQWVEIKGVVRKVQGRGLKLQMPGGDVSVDLGFDFVRDEGQRLIDCTVRLQGVCRAAANEKKQLTGTRLIVPRKDFIFMDEAAPDDPFAVGSQPISRLLQTSDRIEFAHRVKIEGVVTCCAGGSLFIQDATGGIEIAADQAAFQPGDQVEVLGFPESNGSATVSLADALIRKKAAGALPPPVKLGHGLPQAAHGSRLVSLNAMFLGHSPLLDNDVAQLKSGERVFQAMLPKDCGTLPDLELGSLVRVTGVCRVVKDAAGKGSEANPQFALQLSAPADVVLLQAPPWWNWRRLLWIGGLFLGAMAIAAAWIAMILRKNHLLKLAHQELQTANDELEVRVERRTADLAKANAELSHEQALLRTLLDAASDYIYFKDTDSRFVRCSLSLCSQAGLPHEQMVGKTDFDVHGEKLARATLADEQEIIRSGRPLIGKLEKLVHQDGRITWVMTTKMPWRDRDGKTIGTFGISHDITSIKETEARLEQVHQQLVDASRAAGQAEVAASVLHNVGNVLNSVNISASVIRRHFGTSKLLASVQRVADLFLKHQDDLAAFLSQDGRAMKLSGYLKDLTTQMGAEQAKMLDEVATLAKNIEHIKAVVAMQQNYARVGGVAEAQSIPALVEDALRVHAAAIEELHIRVVRQFEPVPEIVADKHRILQILVNLFSNAKWALRENPAADRVLTVEVRHNGGGHLLVRVADNGVGISPGNLERLFQHGFTTRSDGHGFGLHSSILAAREMGGNLAAHSDGPGRGAAFSLEIPCRSK